VEFQSRVQVTATMAEEKKGQLITVAPERQTSGDEQMVLGETKGAKQLIVGAAVARTSQLTAPTMSLAGHERPVFTCKFNPKGTNLASAGGDHLVLVWNVYGDCQNWLVLKGHTGAVLELCWNRDGDQIYTASADKTGSVFDVESGERIKRFRHHTSFVNAVAASRRGVSLVVTGGDDCNALLWDLRIRKPTQSFTAEYQLTSVAFSDDSLQIFAGSIDNTIKCWDLRKKQVLYSLDGHQDTVTGIKLSPNGNFLLSNGMDNSLRTWDVRPYVSGQRAVAVYEGVQHDFEKQLLRCAWSPDGTRISGGSADRFVYIYEVATGRIQYKLPGHAGCVNEVDFHPTEPVIASCANDKLVYLGEIAPSRG